MTKSSDDEAKALQRDVQRLLGRCMLRLQQYERQIKAIVATQEFSGALRDLEAVRAARVDAATRKTLGTLVGEFLGSFKLSGDTVASPKVAADPPDGVATFSFRIGCGLQEHDLERVKAELTELVNLRNNLVHCFIDQHDLWSVDGCQRAQAALIADYDRIDQCYGRLRDWAAEMDQARQSAAEHIQSDTVRNLVIHGIAPDGTVDWPASSLVIGFREAARALALAGDEWVSVADAGKWLVAKYPDQTPERFNCKTWQQALHESRLFDLRHARKDEPGVICFKERANPGKQDAAERIWEVDGKGTLIQPH
jgi:hypothetical protein